MPLGVGDEDAPGEGVVLAVTSGVGVEVPEESGVPLVVDVGVKDGVTDGDTVGVGV